ncbi:hypothetical protein Pmar_PMAR005919 [Perkinsus marinus ATCC 50983]|uniref:Uncharacterized protein n=1 Tax=Perkinsus marinus (strain ATCC 50983 / TXsc) TaxID=423536 RepID=C5LL14_PERM5|nr:hypothetical protein Pmar_PMAR005919 [Perkinsus marinus ATCC 50983]EER02578.1 hypothetical protein Pmar_PMAR005919 [Perkinsus marinus ATCC 50983]|eukprot:XP_002769860.1 hypothetical protein Pmar_PMAR005919 [Perkinsus marinus ATCC 50983]
MMTTTNTTTTTNLGDSTTTSELGGGGGGKVIRMAGVSDYLVRIIKQLNRLRSEGEVLRLLKSTTTSSSPENNDTPPTPPTSSSSSLVVPEDVLSAIFRSAESGSYEHLKSTVNEHITDLRNSRDRFEEQQTLLCEFKKELISSCCGIEFVDDKQNEKEEVKEEEKGKSITTQ